MQIDGTCLCGHIRYEADIDPERVMVCHCTDCQISTGSFRTGVLVEAEKFRLISGTPKVYVKTAESGNLRAISFCPECGTQLHGSHVEKPTTYSLRLGTILQNPALQPKAQIWCRSALPWVFDLESIPKVDKQPILKI